MQLWCIIGRFQPLHKWHEILIETSLQYHPATLVLIGSSNAVDQKNPYSFEIRKQMLERVFQNPKLHIGSLPDFPEDQDWVQLICQYIPDGVKILHLYCGDIHTDSAVICLKKYSEILPFEIKIHEIARSNFPLSGTQVRAWIQKWDSEKLSQSLSPEIYNFIEKPNS